MILAFGDFELDLDLYELRSRGESVPLPPKGFDFLRYLVEHRDRVVTKQELLEQLWPGEAVTESVLPTNVNALRKALGDSRAEPTLIQTVHGRGYRFIGTIDPGDESAHPKPPEAVLRAGAPRPVWGVAALAALALAGFALLQLRTDPVAPTAALPSEPSIVVRPFANLSGDPEQAYFADGITEDLTVDLAGVDDLYVISRHSAAAYKDRNVVSTELGRELGVRYTVEGGVRRDGNRLRITAQLVDAATGYELWSERYDRKFEDIFAIQSEIAEAILRALEIEIHEAELARIQREPTNSLSSYDAYMRGISHFFRYEHAEHLEARRHLERAIALDGGHALAHAYRAATYLTPILFGWDSDMESAERAVDDATRALELEPDLPMALGVLMSGQILTNREYEAVASGRRMMEIDPGLSVVRLTLGLTEISTTRLLSAARAMQGGLEQNPHEAGILVFALGCMLYVRSESDVAVDLWETVLASAPNETHVNIALAQHYVMEGKLQRARELAATVQREDPNFRVRVVEEWSRRIRLDPETSEELAENLRSIGLE